MKKNTMALLASAGSLLACAAPALGGLGVVLGMTAAVVAQAGTRDTIVLVNGQVIEGRIVEETDAVVKVEISVGTIKSVMEYRKADIAKITRGTPADPAPGGTPGPGNPPRTGGTPDVPSAVDDGTVKVYVMNLTGEFGKDISQTPIRQAIKDARNHKPDVIVVKLENEWKLNEFEDAPDDAAAFDQLWRAEDMDDIFTNELEAEWEDPPKVVFWVKNAMGGASFLPLVSPDIYFHSAGKMGGIGNLTLMFEGVGDQVVQQKQYSLRLGHAEGMAARGGHSVEIVRAMASFEYELAVSFNGDEPVYHPGRTAKAGAGEYTLTDDGQGSNADTMQERVQNKGNDVLTLNAEWAYKLKLSKGTVDTLPELMAAMGIEHNHAIVPGRADKIMDSWSSGVGSAGRQLRRLWGEYGDIRVQGEYDERTRARGQQIRKIDEMLSIMKKYEEAVNPRQEGVPDAATLEIIKGQIKLAQLQDRR